MLQIPSRRVSWARVGRARILSRVGMAGWAASIVVQLVWGHAHDSVSASLYLASVGAFVGSYIVWFARGAVPGLIEIDPYSTTLRRGADQDVSLRGRIESAYFVSRYVRGSGRVIQGGRRAPTVELVLTNGDVATIELASFEQAQTVLQALGFAPGQKRVVMPLGSPVRRLYHLLMALAAYFLALLLAAPFRMFGGEWGHVIAGFVMLPVAFAIYFALKALAREPEVIVGNDGAVLKWGVHRRFLRAGEIRAVEQSTIAVPVVVHTSEREVPAIIDGKALDLERRGALASLLRSRFVASTETVASPAAHHFSRGERSLADWRQALTARARTADYRTAATPNDVAGAVLASTASADEERAGAALALRIAGEPPERIRVAAEGVADDNLRLALEAIAEEESEPVLERALARLRRPA